ncbi:MAG: helix-turn-helix transcriptional regulator [Lachnospiraceae bacterium]|nr:helix-turn-helix transcriptional regulator [Lachnospiraceae bacterium]
MTISERIFELLDVRGMSQKDFSTLTGIAQSTISDWKRKKTNPVSEKILVICNVLGVSPYELLGGTEGEGRRSAPSEVIIVEKNTEDGKVISDYLSLDKDLQGRLIGYMKALKELKGTYR